ncbi:uncharacterized protein N0V89_004732 [Didymosphaeria variabile]|uniref:DUF6036 domain-containing protein n=1 Tax=Didymosphaeria variabile TaxID=1932322 RepID=A0A9W9CDV0_9PLEO|nr:uncharacterized protein N0V89_004732 [Didymosphaeria variabile]KAJ4356696.1 hypothetical protein N0V89_004732 [Didymosphaeria variabile]
MSPQRISPQMEAALLECFLSATRLLPLELRSSFILIGGAATVFHNRKRFTQDVDVAASPEAIVHLHSAISSGTTQFKVNADPSQTIEFDSRQDILVHLELLQIGGGFVDSIAAYEPFHDGFIASRADLLKLRGVTVADRGSDTDWADFMFLLEATALSGSILPRMDRCTVEALKEVTGKLSKVDALVLIGLLQEEEEFI